MLDRESKTEGLKFYSQTAIAIATFLGGPLAAGYLIRENYLSLNQPDEGKQAFMIGLAATIFVFGGLFLLPEHVVDMIPRQLIPVVYIAIIHGVVEKIHGPILKQHEADGNEFHSGWKAAGVGLISLLILGVCMFGYIFLSPENAVYDEYDVKMALYSENENEGLVFYDKLDTATDIELLRELDNISIPKWEENLEIIEQISQLENLPEELGSHNEIIFEYTDLRLEVLELFRMAIAENTAEYNLEIEEIHAEIEAELAKLE